MKTMRFLTVAATLIVAIGLVRYSSESRTKKKPTTCGTISSSSAATAGRSEPTPGSAHSIDAIHLRVPIGGEGILEVVLVGDDVSELRPAVMAVLNNAAVVVQTSDAEGEQ